MVTVTGYHPKALIRALRRRPREGSRETRGRPRTYGPGVGQIAYVALTASCDLGLRRLQAGIPDLVGNMRRHGVLQVEDALAELTAKASVATLQRLLRGHLRRERHSGLPSGVAALRSRVPLRTFADWRDKPPGYLQVDLVAHSGPRPEGGHLYTLAAVDVATGWLELAALPDKREGTVLEALRKLRKRLPMPLLGIDCDNGFEFINRSLIEYCEREGITLTRGRPYRKNDSCHIEQKNGAVVRRLLGRDRLPATDKSLHGLSHLYSLVRLHVNFFQPSMKVVASHWSEGRPHRVYDRPQTPYRRLLATGAFRAGAEQRMASRFLGLEPLELVRQMKLAAGKVRSLMISSKPTFGNPIYETRREFR
jgi:Integrase core domain